MIATTASHRRAPSSRTEVITSGQRRRRCSATGNVRLVEYPALGRKAMNLVGFADVERSDVGAKIGEIMFNNRRGFMRLNAEFLWAPEGLGASPARSAECLNTPSPED